MKAAISSVRRLGASRSSTIELASSSRALGSSSASVPASLNGCTGSRRCPITSVSVRSVRRSARCGAMRPKNSPCSTAAPGAGSWRTRVDEEVDHPRQPRHLAGAELDRAHHRLAEAQRDHQRRERERAGQQRAVEHRHLDDHAAQPLGREGGRLERGVGARARCRARPPPRSRGGRAARSSGGRRRSSSSRPDRPAGPRSPWPSRSSVTTRLPRSARLRASGSCMRRLSSRPCSSTTVRGPSP